ncbi:hypothetical protein ABPG72_006128 [Tetrahymena utriculariae]
MQLPDEPLMIRGKGQQVKGVGQLLEERLERCDLELNRVLRLDEQINVFELDIRNLKSIFLEKNVHFKALVEEVKIWNSDLIEFKNGKKTIYRVGFKFNLMKYLAQNLREIVNTKDRQVQLFYLMQLKNWYDRQNDIYLSWRPSTQGGRVSTASRPGTSNQNNNNLFSSMTLKDTNQTFFPSSNLDDYYNNYRSKHSHLDPPEDRIKEFTKKELVEMPLSTNQSRPATVMLNQARPFTQGSRPSTNYQSLRMLSNVDMIPRGASRGGLASAQTNHQEGERLRSSGVINTTPWNYSGSFAFFQSTNISQKQSPIPQIQNQFNQNKISKKDSKESENNENKQDYEQEYGVEQEDQENTPRHEQQMRKTHQGPGILQPTRKAFNQDKNTEMSYVPHVRPSGDIKSTYLNYNPSNEIGEIRLENIWYINRSKAVQEKREQEELENHIQNWAQNKGIMDQEIDKKNEITAHGSKFQDMGVKTQVKHLKSVLSEKNFQQKQMTNEEVEEQSLFNNYINILKLSKEQKQSMAHPSANDESIYEIASKIDQSIRTPRSQRSHSRAISDFQDQVAFEQNLLDQSMSQKQQRKRQLTKKNSELPQENKPQLDERPKTMYVNLREQLKQSQPEINPVLGIEFQMKKNKLAQLRQTRGKIIGQSQAKVGEEADEEEINRRKQQSLQIYHRDSKEIKFRPFSNMYKKITSNTLKLEQLNEIEKVRKGFAKKGIRCSLKTISQSLSRPQGLPMTSLELPSPGSMLFVNPFDQFGKKKSKKKK